jgi:hypothetical protein
MIDLTPIYHYANDILGEADPNEIDGAINWGDLGCTDVQECRSVHDNYTTVTVTIEEADPSNQELRQYVYERLTEKFPGVQFEINTEW